MSGDRAYLIGAGGVPVTGPGRHRSTSRLCIPSLGPGRHRAGRASAGRPGRRPVVPPRRDLPTGVATLLVVLASATAVSGWFAASGAAAVLGMIAH